MGIIVASGGGFDSVHEEIWAFAIHTSELTGKAHPHFLYVPTTQFDAVNPGTLNCRYKLGNEVDVLKVTEIGVTPDIIRRKTGWADIIWVPGGNLKYCRDMWEKTGALEAIREAFDRGAVVTGSSAGAMVWFASGYDNCAIYDEKEFTPGMGLYPYAFCPHFDSPGWQCFAEEVKKQSLPAFAVENGAALCVLPDGESYVFRAAGSEKAWLFDPAKGYEKTEFDGGRLAGR